MTGTALRLRVTNGDSWQSSDLAADAGETVGSVKARVLAADRVPAARAGQYEVKLGGALVEDESRSLASLGIGNGTALIVLPPAAASGAMNRRTTGRLVFGIGFVVLLVDGAAAVWLGQLSGRNLLVVVGVSLLLASAGLVFAFRRWMEALDAVDAARRELKDEIGRLREAAAAARTSRPLN